MELHVRNATKWNAAIIGANASVPDKLKQLLGEKYFPRLMHFCTNHHGPFLHSLQTLNEHVVKRWVSTTLVMHLLLAKWFCVRRCELSN